MIYVLDTELMGFHSCRWSCEKKNMMKKDGWDANAVCARTHSLTANQLVAHLQSATAECRAQSSLSGALPGPRACPGQRLQVAALPWQRMGREPAGGVWVARRAGVWVPGRGPGGCPEPWPQCSIGCAAVLQEWRLKRSLGICHFPQCFCNDVFA